MKMGYCMDYDADKASVIVVKGVDDDRSTHTTTIEITSINNDNTINTYQQDFLWFILFHSN